ncbi:hypothetical protein V8C37DRAFT_31693 [Trichoderma ceciliae]
MAGDSGEGASADVPTTSQDCVGVSNSRPDATSSQPEACENIASPESTKLNPLSKEESRIMDRLRVLYKRGGIGRLMDEWLSPVTLLPPDKADNDAASSAKGPEPGNAKGAAKSEGDGGSAPDDFPKKAVTLFGPATSEQAAAYLQMFAYSSDEHMDLDVVLGMERTTLIASAGLLSFAEELWVLHDLDMPILTYTGAIARQRVGIVSTTKGAKIVRAMVISQLVTNIYDRRRGHATDFLRLLAKEMDSREGQERIAFSVVYSGPNTDFFQKRG